MFELARRCASSLEQSNDQSDAIIRIQTDMHALSMKRYEYERLNSDCFAERERAQRHHEVLCIMLKEITRANAAAGCMNVNGDIVFQQAKAMADLAYPPPKAEP